MIADDEASRNRMLATMAGHVVRETQSTNRGYRWECRCGSTSQGGTGLTGREHQAQAVLDELRFMGWRPPVGGTIDGEVVVQGIRVSDRLGTIRPPTGAIERAPGH